MTSRAVTSVPSPRRPGLRYRLERLALTARRRGHIVNHMVENREVSLDGTFSALAHPTRRDLLRRLAAGETTVGELAAPYSVSLAAISKHLQVLEGAGLVRRRVRGREHHLSLEAGPMRAAAAWLVEYREFWSRSLDALEAIAREEGS